MEAIRKDITAESAVRDKYVEGVLRLKREINPQRGLSTYDALVVWHVRAMMKMTPPNQSSRNAAHRGPVFLPWHRYLLIVFEQQLQRVLQDDTFGHPYWAWNRDGDLPPAQQAKAPVWGAHCMGGSGDPVTTGPFANPNADPDKFIVRVESNSIGQLVRANRGLARNVAGDNISTLPTTAQARAAVGLDTYDEPGWSVDSSTTMRNAVEGGQPDPPGMHNRGHVWIGGDMAPGTIPRHTICGPLRGTRFAFGSEGLVAASTISRLAPRAERF
jgi:tyrosinase